MKLWQIAVRRVNWKATKLSYLCSKHFRDEDFIVKKSETTRARLKKDAVPSIFDFPKHLVKRRKHRPSPKKGKISCAEKKQKLHKVYIKNILHDHCYVNKSPVHEISKIKSKMLKIKKKYKTVYQNKCRKEQKISKLKSLIKQMKENGRILPETEAIINNFDDLAVEIMKNEQRNRGKKRPFYNKTIKAFSITLHYLSSNAYKFLRGHFRLPSERMIRYWSSNLKIEPGFTEQVFLKLGNLIQDKKIQPQCALLIDEAAIREEMVYDHSKKCFTGFINFGHDAQEGGELPLATDVLVLMCVSLKEHTKYPIAYFFTRKINSNTLTEIVKSSICKLHNVGMEVKAIVFDGLLTNICMAENLGAKLQQGDIIPFILNPANQEECYIIYDACHMLKLLRNALSDYRKIFKSDAQNPIEWIYIEKLYEKQILEELHLGKKLQKKHIEWQRHKMNVKLAAQVFSNSVADAIDFLREDLKLPEFQNSKETSDFIRLINNTFDLLNSRSKFGKRFNQPLSLKNIDLWKTTLDSFINTISILKDEKGKLMINGKRKTAFRGFIATAKSVQLLAQNLLSGQSNLEYILTYRLSQDHLELFFNRIRRANGLNNNPNVIQFKNAYKKLLLKNFVPPSSTGNCEIWADEINSFLDMKIDNDNMEKPLEEEENMLNTIDSNIIDDSKYKNNCLVYIAGYIVKNIHLKCLDCQNVLKAHEGDYPNANEMKLLLRKNYEKQGMALCIPSNSVCTIIKLCDNIFRSLKNMSSIKQIDLYVLRNVMNKMNNASLFCHAKQHFMEFITHYPSLVKLIINKFVKIRAHSYSNLRHNVVSRRQQLSRQIIFLRQ